MAKFKDKYKATSKLFTDKDDGEIMSSYASDIRICFTEVRFKAHEISDFCRNEKFCHLLITNFIRVLFIQCSVMNQLTTQWYQLEIDKYFISGLPAEGNTPEVKSLKEKYHDNLVEGLQSICKAVHKNNRDGKPELNKEFDEKAEKLFNTNTWMYPFPIVVAPLNVPSFISKLHQIDENVPTHKIPDREGQYIYRIDAANFQYDKKYQAWHEGKIQTFRVDPLTKCKGACPDIGLSLNFKLTRKRTFKIRVFGIYTFSKDQQIKIVVYDPSTTSLIRINWEENDIYKYPTVSTSFPNLPPMTECVPSMEVWYSDSFVPSIKDHSGFTTTNKLKNVSDFNVFIQTTKEVDDDDDEDDNLSKGFIKFVEIIFLDK